MIIRCTSQEYITNWWQYSFNQINWNKRFLHEYKFKKLVSSNHRAVIGVDITWTYQNCDLWIVSRRREINYSITLQQLQLPTWDGNARSKQAREKRRITRWTAPPPAPPPPQKNNNKQFSANSCFALCPFIRAKCSKSVTTKETWLLLVWFESF